MITKADVRAWKNNPVSARLFDVLKETQADYEKRFKKQFDTVDKAAMNASFTQGYLEAINLVLDAELHDEENEASSSEDQTQD